MCLVRLDSGCIYEASLPLAVFQDHGQLIYLQGFKLNLCSKYIATCIGLRVANY